MKQSFTFENIYYLKINKINVMLMKKYAIIEIDIM